LESSQQLSPSSSDFRNGKKKKEAAGERKRKRKSKIEWFHPENGDSAPSRAGEKIQHTAHGTAVAVEN
jgi:hypothetical protein